MDNIIKGLVNPIEIFINDYQTTNLNLNKIPDTFRPYYFNKPYLTPEKAKKCPKDSGVKMKYWSTGYDIINKLSKTVQQFENLPDNRISAYFQGKIKSEVLDCYYKKIYDICDVIIGRKLEIPALRILFDADAKIKFRIIFYLSSYFNKRQPTEKYIKTVYHKIKEFMVIPLSEEHFINNELIHYEAFLIDIFNKNFPDKSIDDQI